MSLIDLLAEKQILAAQRQGDFDCLPGQGQPLQLDDDSHVPPELRVSYRILKNAGYLPPELEMRREAVELDSLLTEIDKQHGDYQAHTDRLRLLELKLKQAGINTDFLRSEYAGKLQQRFSGTE